MPRPPRSITLRIELVATVAETYDDGEDVDWSPAPPDAHLADLVLLGAAIRALDRAPRRRTSGPASVTARSSRSTGRRRRSRNYRRRSRQPSSQTLTSRTFTRRCVPTR
jgi:hypothetical protein